MEEKYRKKLTTKEYNVLRKKGTEPAFSGKYHNNKKAGMYSCKACGNKIFNSKTKFDSGTGWPSFDDAILGSIKTKKDFSMIIPRTEVVCSKCESHLGHLFKDGPTKTKKRYCINSVCLNFKDKNGKKN